MWADLSLRITLRNGNPPPPFFGSRLSAGWCPGFRISAELFGVSGTQIYQLTMLWSGFQGTGPAKCQTCECNSRPRIRSSSTSSPWRSLHCPRSSTYYYIRLLVRYLGPRWSQKYMSSSPKQGPFHGPFQKGAVASWGPQKGPRI